MDPLQELRRFTQLTDVRATLARVGQQHDRQRGLGEALAQHALPPGEVDDPCIRQLPVDRLAEQSSPVISSPPMLRSSNPLRTAS
jgi:hypothetical protein